MSSHHVPVFPGRRLGQLLGELLSERPRLADWGILTPGLRFYPVPGETCPGIRLLTP